MNNKRILIIDDNEIILLSIKNILKKGQFSVVTASCGIDGLTKFVENIFDIVFLDIGLPDYNGLDILKEIKSKNQYIPVIIITAYGKETYYDDAIKLKADDYIEKPFDDGTILRTIEKHCNNKEKDCVRSHL